MSDPDKFIAHCSSCGCKMDITAMDPYTNVVCPECGHHTRVKCDLGHYLLTSRHAAGGMSMVFVARDTTLERDVAIKILNENYSRDVKRMEEFEREAKITAALSHPHIVRVFTVGKSFGHYFIAMEMVSGGDLERRISKGGAVGEEEMLPIALEIISGLRAAKSAGVIHRDVKPGNILFDDAGHVKIVDFGLALVTMGEKVKADEIWATPYYVPPEALDGEPEDFRSDIYALGATLYHALSGQTPLPAEAKSTKDVRKAKEHIPPLAEVAPWLNSGTCRLVDKAMALRPEDRFASYAEMEEAWNVAFQIMRGGGAEKPIHGQDRLRRRVKGRGPLIGGGILLLVVLLLAVFGRYVLKNQGETDQKTSGDEVVSATSQVESDALLKGSGGYNPEMAARIGRLIRSSHALLGRRKYAEAQNQFIAIIHDPDIKEPLPSWARIESLIAVWLAGDPIAIEETMGGGRSHHVSQKNDQTEYFLALEKSLTGFGIVQAPDKVSDEPMAVIELMALALKNWEVGAWDEAVPLLNRVKAHPLPSGSPLMVYRKIAQNYLDDYKRLKSLPHQGVVKNREDANIQLGEFKKLLGELKTNGRARFFVRMWQLRLHRQIKQMCVDEQKRIAAQNSKVNKKAVFDDVFPEFKTLLAELKFAQASALLKKSVAEGERKEVRDAWVYLADSSHCFLTLLEGSIPKGGAAVSVKTQGDKETVYRKVVSGKVGGLVLLGDDGAVFVPWSKIKKESVIAIFQKVFKSTISTPKGQLDTEMAICYAWVVGMEEKARLAATKLSEENPKFRQRWNKSMHILDLYQ